MFAPPPPPFKRHPCRRYVLSFSRSLPVALYLYPFYVLSTRQFLIKTGTKSLEVKEKGLDKTCGEMLRKLCEKYDDLLQVDKLAAVMNKVDSVKLVLQENVQVALANCVTLENIESAAGMYICTGGGKRKRGSLFFKI